MHDPRTARLYKRIDDSVKFYKGQGDLHRRLYMSLNAIQIVSASLVPILAFSLPDPDAKLGAAIAGAVAAVSKGLDSLAKSHENWIRDVDTRNNLLSEQSQFDARSGAYANATDPVALLSTRIESLMAAERIMWATIEKKAGAEAPEAVKDNAHQAT